MDYTAWLYYKVLGSKSKSGEYEFIFDAETARETLMNAIYF